jgi:hypothetical protein
MTFTTMPAPAVPIQMSAPTISSVTNTAIDASWAFLTLDSENNGYPVTLYELSFAMSGYTNWTVLSSANTNSYSHTSGFLLGKQYNYRLRAYN